MVTAGVPSWNIILSDEFYIFDGAQKLKSNWWTKKTPRKVKVTFEKALGQYEEYCLRLLDPTGRHSPVYYHLGSERSAFFGTDRGKLTCKKKLLDLRSSVTYSFLTVYVACGDLSSRQSCVLLKTDWPEEKQEHWQSTINEALGLRGSWSVERNVGKNSERERVLLSLTSRGLALNSKNLSDGRELPTCLWYHTFSDFTMVANFSATESTIKISCRQKGVQEKLVEYDLITSQGQAISSAIYKVSGLKPILPPIHLGSPNPKTQTVDVDETTPPPCPNSRIFANKPSSVKSHNIPSIKSKDTSLLPLPAPGSPVNQTFSDNPESKSQLRMRSPRNYRHARNRVVGPEDMQPTDNDKDKHFHRKPSNKSSHIYSSLRRSFSLGEKEFKGISRYRKTKRGGVSLGDGYGSESNDIDQLAPAAHEGDADRGTLYLHNKWFNVFKGQLPVQGFTGGVTTFSVCRPNIREQLSSGGQQDTVDDDYYWTKEISFSLQKVLENKVPHPDTMKLTRRQRIRLTFLLYPTTAGLSGGWQELAGYLGLTLQDVAIVENFCLFHHYGPIEILLLHWQFVYNKQEKPQHRHLLSEPLIPPCTQSQLTTYLLKMKRSDIIEACNFVTLDTTCI